MSRRKKGLTIGKTRTALYKAGKILGDINAIKRGTVGQRIVRRSMGWTFGRMMGGLMRALFGRG